VKPPTAPPAHTRPAERPRRLPCHGPDCPHATQEELRLLHACKQSIRPSNTSAFMSNVLELVVLNEPGFLRSLFPVQSGIGSRCCLRYPSDTGLNLERAPRRHRAILHLYFPDPQIEPTFMLFFQHALPVILRENQSFVLVTNADDHNVPWELFSCYSQLRRVFDNTSMADNTSAMLRSFLATPNLLRWYTNNLDTVPHKGKRLPLGWTRPWGTQYKRCAMSISKSHDSDLDPMRDASLLSKLQPLPLGWELQLAPNVFFGGHQPQLTSLTSGASAAHMQWPTSRSRWSPVECYSFASYSLQVMHSLQAASAPLRSRVARVLISFNGNMDRRSQALSALRKSGLADDVQEVVAKRASSSPHVLKPSRVARYDLWWAYTQYAFVAAPPSHGQDTYRFWEVLTLGSIPLVPSGPLDSFYARFPCVILRSWDSITPELLDSQMAVLLQRIRNGSFDRRLMHSGYYADRIRDAQPI